MKIIGLFRDIDSSISSLAPSIFDVLNSADVKESLKVASYLENGIGVSVTMGALLDPVDKITYISGAQSILTDGEWIWRRDLIYYVKKYHILLPIEFLKIALNTNGPSLVIEDLNVDAVCNCYDYGRRNPSIDVYVPTICGAS